MATWTVEKMLTGLKFIFHRKNFPVRSLLNCNSEQNTFNEEKLLELLKDIYKSDEKYELYGSVEETFEMLKLIEQQPRLITFSTRNCERGCVINTFGVFTYEDSNKDAYISKQDIAFLFISTAMKFLTENRINSLVHQFFSGWVLSLFNKIQRDLGKCFELIPKSAWKSIESDINELQKVCNVKGNEHVQFERFEKLRFFMEQNDEYLLDLPFADLHEMMEIQNITENQKLYLNMYSSIITFIKNTENIYKRYIAVFTPFSDNTIKSKHHVPIVRLFMNCDEKYFFAKELEDALEIAMKNRYPNNFFPKGLIQVENEEDRRDGIVYSVSYEVFQSVIKQLALSEDDLKVCNVPLIRDYAYSYLPIPSPYGSLCKPALHVFDGLIYFITVILNSFEVKGDESFQNLLSWIKRLSYLFTEKENFYFLESWKTDQINDRARLELRVTFKNWKGTKKIFADKLEVLSEVRNLTRNISLDREVIANSIDTLIPTKTEFTIKDVYYIFSQNIKLNILSKSEKMARFFLNQTKKCGGDEMRWCTLSLSKMNKLEENKSLILDGEKFYIETENIRTADVLSNNLEKELRRVQKANAQLQKVETVLKRRLLVLEDVHEKNEELREDAQKRNDQIKQLENELSMAVNSTVQLESAKRYWKNKCKTAKDELSYLQMTLEETNDSYATSEKARKELEEEKSVLLTENQKLTTRVDDIEKYHFNRLMELKAILEDKDNQTLQQ